MLQVSNEHHLNVGATVKRLFPRGHVAMNVEEADYLFTSNNLFIDNMVGDIATAAPGLKGGGWAADLGVEFKRTINGKKTYIPFSSESRCIKVDYKYKIGASLLDVGAINFRQGAENTRITNSAIFWPDYQNTQPNGIQGLDSIIDLRFENDQVVFENSSDYSVSLPRAFTIHGDVHMKDNFFLGAVLVQNVQSKKLHSLRRTNVLGIIPRYETQKFEFSLPFSFTEYNRMRTGMALRWKFIIFGTDDLLPLFVSKAYGLDMYFDLKIPIFGKGNCGNPRAGLKRRGMVAPCWGG
jgi:hypothetical protein